MAAGRITKRSVDALKCAAGKDRTFLWDRDVSGFGVGAFPSGKKIYVVQYRQNGRSRRAKLGEHGRLTPEQARSLAKKALGAVESGADPVAERRASRAVRTFTDVAGDFMRTHVGPKRKERTAGAYTEALRLHILPAIGSMRVSDIRTGDVARLHLKLADRPALANKCLAIISSAWRWAQKHDEAGIGANPVSSVSKYAERRREQFLTADELERLGDALREGETLGLPATTVAGNRRFQLDPYAVAAIRLLTLTGARLREILRLQWEHVDFERGMIFLPDSKTGQKAVYLSAAALAVLSSLRRPPGNPFVIVGGREGAARADLKKPWTAVTRAAGLQGLRIHACGTHSPASEREPRLVCRSSVGSSAILSRPPQPAMPIWMPIHCVVLLTPLVRPFHQRWKAEIQRTLCESSDDLISIWTWRALDRTNIKEGHSSSISEIP